MHEPTTYDQWAHREEARERREQHDQKRQQAELFDEFATSPDSDEEEEPEPECECVQIDADEWSARYCPAHGPHSAAAREQRAREAAAEFEYWNSPGWAAVFAECEDKLPARKPAASETGVKEEVA